MRAGVSSLGASLTLVGLLLGPPGAEGRPGPESLPGGGHGGSRWAIVVGVDEYQDAEIKRLEGAVADAAGIASALRRYAGFPPSQVLTLTSDGASTKPTAAAILDRLFELKAAVKEGDLLLFFFAGHGVEIERQRYLLTYEASNESVGTLKRTALPVAELLQAIQSVPVRHRIVMVDACRDDPINPGRPALPKAATEDLERLFMLQPSSEEGTRAHFMSSKSGQYAYEWREERRGFFSYFIEKGLSGAAANPWGQVTVTSLAGYLNESVPRAVREQRGKEQTPMRWLVGEELVLVQGVAPTPPPSPGSGTRTVYGMVKDSAGTPVAGTGVRMAWEGGASRGAGRGGAAPEATLATSDEDGFFKAAVPRLATVTISAGGVGGFGVVSTTSSPDDDGKKVSLFLPRSSAAANAAQELARVAYQAFLVEEWKEAEHSARSALQQDPRCSLAQAVLANALAFRGVNDSDRASLASARQWAQAAVEANPRMALAHNALGLVLYGSGDKGGAEVAFRAAAQLDPGLGVALSNLGQVYLDFRRYDRAEAAFRQSIRARPDSAVPYNGLAQVLTAQGRERAREAVRAALDAISLYPLRDAYLGRFYLNLAAALHADGRKSAAREAEARAAILGARRS
jgi:tetratricopeptide (TPR) repeat protein